MNKRSNISFFAALLIALACPLSVEAADIRTQVCMGARVLYAANGWDGSTYEFTLDPPEAGTLIRTHNDSIIVEWGMTRGIYRLGVRETSFRGCVGDWAYLEVQVTGDVAEFEHLTYNICGDSAVYVNFNKANFIAWEWVDRTIPENGRITRPGRYELRTIDQNSCLLSSYVDVIQTPMPRVTLRPDTMICTQLFTLYALNTQNNPPETVYTWSTGEPGAFQTTITSGTNVRSVMIADRDMDVDNRYWVHAEYNGCYASDTARVRACVIPTIYNIPNTITPNDDGDNDEWNISILQDYPNSIVEIFDRWGRRVFISPRGYPTPWDGRDMNRRELPMEAYYYIIQVNDAIGTPPVHGTITIIR